MKKTYLQTYSFEAEQVGNPATFPGVCYREVTDSDDNTVETEWVIDLSPFGSHMWRTIRRGDWVITNTDGRTNMRSVVSDEDFQRSYKEAV